MTKHCPLCKGTNYRPYYNLSYPCEKVTNVVCENCGLVYLNPKPSFDELTLYYANYSENTQPETATIPQWFAEFGHSIARQRLEYLSPFLRNKDKVLDIGCSFGAMMNVLKTEVGKSLKVIGVNPEPGYVRAGQELYDLDIRVGMFEEQNFSPETLDVVILDNVIEHFIDPVQSISKIHDLMSEQGRLYIVTNDIDRPHGFLWQNFFPDHTVTFSTRTLTALLESQGFKVLDMNVEGHVTYEGYHYPYIQCMAEKVRQPVTYNFSENGDNALNRIKFSKTYLKNFLAVNGFAKRVYQYRLLNKHSDNSIFEFCVGILGKLGLQSHYVPMGHTPPTEEHVYRRICIGFCDSLSDVELVNRQILNNNFNPLVFILSRHETGVNYKVLTHPLFIGSEKLPNGFKTPELFFRWMMKSYIHVDELIYLQSSNAELYDDRALIDTYNDYRLSNKSASVITPKINQSNVPFAPEATLKWLFLDGSRIDELLSIRLDEALQEFAGVDTPEVRRRISNRNKHHQRIAIHKKSDLVN